MPIPLKEYNKKLLFLFVIVVAILLRFRFPQQVAEHLVVPDGIEYSVSAINLLEGKGYTLFINSKPYPPRAPFGYSLCLVPFYVLFGTSLGNGIFCTLFFSLASILLVYLLANSLFGKEVAFWAAVFLAFSPLHIYWSRQVMADVPSSLFVLLSLWTLLNTETTFLKRFSSGLLLGISCWVKYLNLLFVFPALVILSRGEKCFKKGSLRGISFLGGLTLSMLPLFLYNHFTFGSPLETGFSYWTPEWMGWREMFSPFYALHEPRLPIAASPNLLAYGRFFLGLFSPWHQNPYPFFLVPLIVIGAFKIFRTRGEAGKKRREFLFFSLCTLALFYGFFSFYFAQNMRYFISFLPVLIILGAVGFVQFYERWPISIQKGMIILLGVALAFSPFLLGKMDKKSSTKATYLQIIRTKTEDGSYLVTSWDPVLFFHEVQRGSRRNYLPLSEWIEYVHEPFRQDPRRKLSFLVAGEDPQGVKKITQKGIAVYLDSLSCQQYPDECRVLQGTFHFREVAFLEGIYLYRLE